MPRSLYIPLSMVCVLLTITLSRAVQAAGSACNAPPLSHTGTRVANVTTEPQLQSAVTNGNVAKALEFRFGTTGSEAKNNLTDAPLGARDGATFAQSNNYLAATPAMFVNPARAALHLLDTDATRASVIGRGVVLSAVRDDMDGNARPAGAGYTSGADELRSPPPSGGARALRRSASGRWFYDPGLGKSLFLTGVYTAGGDYAPAQDNFWCNQNTPHGGLAIDNAFQDRFNHNYIRFWTMESTASTECASNVTMPMVFARSQSCCAADGGNLFDLDTLDGSYFAKLKSTLNMLPPGRHASVMLFEGAGNQDKDFWFYSPMNQTNNINTDQGTVDMSTVHKTVAQGNSSYIWGRQKAYVERLVRELSEYNNIIYEIANEDGNGSIEWQQAVAEVIRAADTANPHLIGMSFRWLTGNNPELYSSNADWIAPILDPSASEAGDGRKTVVFEGDHSASVNNKKPSAEEVWRLFMRGYHVSVLAYHLPLPMEPVLMSMGRAAYFANKRFADLDAMIPQSGGDSPASTGYCLSNPGVEYLVFQPGTGDVVVDLPAGAYHYEWHTADGGSPAAPTPVEKRAITSSGGSQTFSQPEGANILYIVKRGG